MMSDYQIALEGIKAELEAIMLYENLLKKTTDKVLAKTLGDIILEEKKHVGEFLANILDKDADLLNNGIDEVCKLAKMIDVDHPACRMKL